ncbi:hypothetical protein AK830_g12542 [Neonectria ditissima]|uniref:Uncharacterized protein n=1 Tax=Neonectria ditissima TaxID=78410 RepID=A0A0P7AK30_9HYPO|nr:hypothetical protein AK830_g12542 [Neonectria ditissima]
MGGSAFAAGEDPLFTPRMPKDVYHIVKARCNALLREHYVCVASPIDGPGKQDFGDVDILLAWPRNPSASKADAFDTIARALNATRTIVDKGKDVSGHLALPWPQASQEPSTEPNDAAQEAFAINSHGYGHPAAPAHQEAHESDQKPSSNQPDQVSSLAAPLEQRGFQTTNAAQSDEPHQASDQPKRFIQVDVRVCETLEYFEWMLFKHAHGDVWNLLGTTIRPYGLSVDERALWLRIPEIEAFHRNRAKVFLTGDPVEILQFLGLPIGDFWTEPFQDLDAMYEYVARCRLFWVRPLDPEEAELEQDRKKLKANDRKRMNQRPGFRKWVEEFKPRCRQEGRFLINPTTREQVTEEAFAWFHVKGEYEARRVEFLREKQKDMVWNKIIKGAVPDADPSDQISIMYRSCLIKALKRVILENDDRYGVLPEQSLLDEDGFYITEDVLDFINRRKGEIGRAAMDINQAGYEKKKAAKTAEKVKPAQVLWYTFIQSFSLRVC